MIAGLLAAALAGAGCAGSGPPAGASPSASPPPTAAEDPPATEPSPASAPTPFVLERGAPLPAPGEGGVTARHGGVVEAADGIFLELVPAEGRALVYLYAPDGTALRPARVSGSLVLGSLPAATLERRQEGGEVLLAAPVAAWPASAEATVTVEADGKSHRARLRIARHGQRGTWAEK